METVPEGTNYFPALRDSPFLLSAGRLKPALMRTGKELHERRRDLNEAESFLTDVEVRDSLG